jgi:hypothetical protein
LISGRPTIASLSSLYLLIFSSVSISSSVAKESNMSQTQPELKTMVSDLFGDSSDEEDNNDDDLDDSPVIVPASSFLKSTPDEDDLFNSDDESEDEVSKDSMRLSKGSVAKKVLYVVYVNDVLSHH